MYLKHLATMERIDNMQKEKGVVAAGIFANALLKVSKDYNDVIHIVSWHFRTSIHRA